MRNHPWFKATYFIFNMVILMMFLALAWYCFDEDKGYTWHDRQAFHELHERVAGEAPRLQQQAAAYVYLYDIRGHQLDGDIFGERK